jgi:hypothetical protein
MRARVALLLGLVAAPATMSRIERKCVLCAKNPLHETREALLTLLARDTAAELAAIHPGLPGRLETYRALESFCGRYRTRYTRYRTVLRERGPGLIKAVLALADMGFLREELPEDPFELLREELSGSPAALPSAEDACAMFSLLVAEAAEERPISELELAIPVAFGLNAETLNDVLPMASIRFRVHELTKQITALGYHLAHERGRKHIYKLVEPREGIERYFRMAHITAQTKNVSRQPASPSSGEGDGMQIARPLDELLESPAVPLRVLAEVLTQKLGADLYHLEELPCPRYVLTIPMMPHLISGVNYDDYVRTHATAGDFILPHGALRQTRITPDLTLGGLMDAHRAIQFMAAVHTAVLRRAFGSYQEAALNTMLPTFPRSQMIDLLRWAAPDVRDTTLQAAIDTLCWSEHNTFLDLQYRPIVRAGDTYVLLPRVAARSALERNTLTSLHLRIPDAGPMFTQIVARELKEHFPHVAHERRLRGPKQQVGDVDVALLLDRRLYLFECKYSVLGANTHEFADIFLYIEQAREQLRTALDFLNGHRDLRALLRSWFPAASDADLMVEHVQPCILTSTRLLSGMTYDGVPVRDWFSFRRFVERGDVEVTGLVDGAVHGLRAKLWQGTTCRGADLDDYLSSSGRAARVREQYLCAYTDIEFYDEHAVVAREGVLASFPTNIDEWREDFEKLGLAIEEINEPADKIVTAEAFMAKLQASKP